MEPVVQLVREWEDHGEGQTVTVTQACEKFMTDAEVRFKPQSVKRYRLLSEELKCEWQDLPVREISAVLFGNPVKVVERHYSLVSNPGKSRCKRQ